MAAKMQSALTRDGVKISAEDAEKNGVKDGLTCAGNECGAPLNHVDSYNAQHGEKICVVRTFFRIARNKAHGPHCQFDIARQIEVLARDSDPEIIAPIFGGLQFRLLAVSQLISNLVRKPNRPVIDEGELPAVTRVYENSDQAKLSKYLNSAARVLRLRSVVEAHADISQIKLNFGKTAVKWENFYFDSEMYLQCFNQKAAFPRAIFGTVRDRKKLPDGRSVLNIRNAIQQKQSGVPNECDAVAPAVWADDSKRPPQPLLKVKPTQVKRAASNFVETG